MNPGDRLDHTMTLLERDRLKKKRQRIIDKAKRKVDAEFNQFNEDETADELSAILKRNRERKLSLGDGDTPLRAQVANILGKPVDVAQYERPASRKRFIEDSLVVAETEMESKFGSKLHEKVAGWRAYAKQNKRLPMGQCVYLVAGSRTCKIGRSIEVGKRLAAIRMHSPVPVTLIRAVVCGSGVKAADHVEKELHTAFRERHSHGEWYQLREQDIQYLDLSCEPWLVKYEDVELWEDAA